MKIARFAALGLVAAGITLLGAAGGSLFWAYNQGDPFDFGEDD